MKIANRSHSDRLHPHIPGTSDLTEAPKIWTTRPGLSLPRYDPDFSVESRSYPRFARHLRSQIGRVTQQYTLGFEQTCQLVHWIVTVWVVSAGDDMPFL